MKSNSTIILSIRPEWVAKILNGEKTIEVRKFAIPQGTRVLMYCTKAKPYIFLNRGSSDIKRIEHLNVFMNPYIEKEIADNGSIVGEFIAGKCAEYVNGMLWNWNEESGNHNDYEKMLDPSCLTDDELRDYCQDLCFYSIPIANLQIYNKPKDLSEFGIKKAPQSWCYAKEVIIEDEKS